MKITSPIDGQVTTWDVVNLLEGRTVQPGQVLMSVSDPSGEWELEVLIPEEHMGYIAAPKRSLAHNDLEASYILANDPSNRHEGTVGDVHLAAEVRGEEGDTVLVHVAIDKQDLKELSQGAGVSARVYCGKRRSASCGSTTCSSSCIPRSYSASKPAAASAIGMRPSAYGKLSGANRMSAGQRRSSSMLRVSIIACGIVLAAALSALRRRSTTGSSTEAHIRYPECLVKLIDRFDVQVSAQEAGVLQSLEAHEGSKSRPARCWGRSTTARPKAKKVAVAEHKVAQTEAENNVDIRFEPGPVGRGRNEFRLNEEANRLATKARPKVEMEKLRLQWKKAHRPSSRPS